MEGRLVSAPSIRPALYTVKDAAVRTSLSPWEIRRLIEIGALERRYIGEGQRYYRVTADSVERYLESLPSEREGA